MITRSIFKASFKKLYESRFWEVQDLGNGVVLVMRAEAPMLMPAQIAQLSTFLDGLHTPWFLEFDKEYDRLVIHVFCLD